MKRNPNVVVIGSLNMDIVVEADRPPQMGETIIGNHVYFIPGGKGANQAVASARLGAQTTLIGAVGNDAFGKELLASLAKEGISTDSVKTVAELPTGVASILLAQGDNNIIVVPGANSVCLPEDIARNEDTIARADVVLLQLEIPLATVVYAAETAKRLGKTVILNPAPARQLPDELFRNVDVIIPNQTELALLAGIAIEDDRDLQTAMQRLLEKGVQTVITTLGSDGSALLQRGKELAKVPARKVKVVDTTGAGDAFNAGFAYSLAIGRQADEAVSFASKVAALAVTKLGAQKGMPTLAEVHALETAEG
jgi:ribokinase